MFKKNIEPRREEILREYKKKHTQKQKIQAQEEYGRGHRVAHKPTKSLDEELSIPSSSITDINEKVSALYLI